MALATSPFQNKTPNKAPTPIPQPTTGPTQDQTNDPKWIQVTAIDGSTMYIPAWK